uniref:Uncharacterized protein n=1 Tax=Lepeophtheirus salmonis TaxID=72036 RepID=A0A0K2UYU6_LEPSM
MYPYYILRQKTIHRINKTKIHSTFSRMELINCGFIMVIKYDYWVHRIVCLSWLWIFVSTFFIEYMY